MKRKPCCRKPKVRFVGTKQCDAFQTGCSSIDWYQCRNCLKQFSEIKWAKDEKPPPPLPDPEKAVRPAVSPECCGVEMVWGGRESMSSATLNLSFDQWKCKHCNRTVRIPVEEPDEEQDDD